MLHPICLKLQYAYFIISRAQPTLKLPCISPQSSVTCNGEYRRPVIKAQPSFHDVDAETICHITNGAVFSTFKRTDSHTVRGRPTRKDGVVIYERLFRNGLFRELKIAKSHDLAKFLLEPNQESNWMNVISEQKMRAECYYRRKKNIYDADKEKVHRDQTLGNTGGNNNKDAMFDWRSGCQSEDKCNCHIHLTSIMITTSFCTNREHYRLLFSYFFH